VIKKRIIPVLTILEDKLVKTKKFTNPLIVGNLYNTSKIYNDSDADEIIILNIDEKIENKIENLIKNLNQITKYCFMPLAFGGGIRNMDHVDKLINNGADKVILNSICYQEHQLISKISKKYGSQSIIISIDIKFCKEEEEYKLYSKNGTKLEEVKIYEHILKVQSEGAGELFINSIDNDGMKCGYDINLIKNIKQISKIPIISCGGAGNFNHIKDLFLNTDISAAACGSLFNFGDNNPVRAKAYLKNYGIKFRSVK
jgi:cyclase